MFENRVLRRIIGSGRDEVTGEMRKLHSEEMNYLYSSPKFARVIKSRRRKWALHVARIGKRIVAYRVLVRKPEGKRALGRPRRRWDDNIKIDIQKVGWRSMDRFELAQDRDRWWAFVNVVMNVRVP